MKNKKVRCFSLSDGILDWIDKVRLACDCSHSRAVELICLVSIDSGIDFLKKCYNKEFNNVFKDNRKNNKGKKREE